MQLGYEPVPGSPHKLKALVKRRGKSHLSPRGSDAAAARWLRAHSDDVVAWAALLALVALVLLAWAARGGGGVPGAPGRMQRSRRGLVGPGVAGGGAYTPAGAAPSAARDADPVRG